MLCFVVECLHQHCVPLCDWFEDVYHQMQSRVKRQRGSGEMLGQSRAEERRDDGNISHLIKCAEQISRKSKIKKWKIGKDTWYLVLGTWYWLHGKWYLVIMGNW